MSAAETKVAATQDGAPPELLPGPEYLVPGG